MWPRETGLTSRPSRSRGSKNAASNGPAPSVPSVRLHARTTQIQAPACSIGQEALSKTTTATAPFELLQARFQWFGRKQGREQSGQNSHILSSLQFQLTACATNRPGLPFASNSLFLSLFACVFLSCLMLRLFLLAMRKQTAQQGACPKRQRIRGDCD